MGSPSEVRSVLHDFVADFQSHVDAHRLEELLRGDDTLTAAEIGSLPESWTRHHLIRPLFEAVDFEWENEIHGGGEGYPDFGITNIEVPVIGEDKSINKIEKAEEDIEDYLNNRAASRDAEYGIATDGIEWRTRRIELGGDYLNYDAVGEDVDFRDVLLQIAREKNYLGRTDLAEVDVDEEIERFYNTFSLDEFDTLLVQEAPREIRERKKAGIEEFYDLYVELLFGEGTGDHEYETTLLNEIRAPAGATDTDRRKFAIKLVNRLLFVKFLEDREVLPDDEFLRERVDKYQQVRANVDEFSGGLYKSQIEPLFFSLFNTEETERFAKHRGSWLDRIPYLNGSLFAPEDREKEYDVDDEMLVNVVKDLVEGHRLQRDENGDSGLDPSVLGNVFEMTINHISGGEAQKEEGAYYTPTDVIRLITKQAVDPKVYGILLDVYVDRITDGSTMSEVDARSLVSEYDLGEMLREIEQRHGYFSDPTAIEVAYEQLGSLQVIDPACGSGHFLTGVLDEIHRVRMSLLRGLKGDDLEESDVYQAKKDLVLHSIYGVDINPIGVEIAKLRVWLKMVEEGWKRGYGELPNIDINIVDGNSLIGLPARSDGQSMLSAFDVDLSEIRDVRDEYRSGRITRRELNERIEELRPELRQQYLGRLNHYLDERITATEQWNTITEGLDDLYPTVRKVTARRSDNEELSEAQKDRLTGEGFRVEPRYEKSAKVESDDVDGVDDFADLLAGGLVFDVERQPVLHDLRELQELKHRPERLALSYEPFHWPLEFPEAVSRNGNGYEVEFDIVVGNPPYGNVLEDAEKRFTAGYNTDSVNDIVAQFVERELHILDEDGYFGNILALMFAYQTNASSVRDVIRNGLKQARVACFSRRPSQVFHGSQARTGIITAQRQDDDVDAESPIWTSRFHRFSNETREEVLRNVAYESTAGLTLGKKIGSGEDYSLPKIGESAIKSVIEKLQDRSDTIFRDTMSRNDSDETEYVVWRSYHPAYFVNPFLENLYPPGEESRDFKPMYFESQIERETAFLLMQSSLFYLYWMVYENERDLNWKSVEAFPFPPRDELQKNDERIHQLAEKLWTEMEDRFLGNIRETFDTIGVVKPIADAADDLFGPMYGLTEEEITFVKRYDEEYRLSDVDQRQLVSFDFEE